MTDLFDDTLSYTAINNELLDSMLLNLTDSEFKLLMYIIIEATAFKDLRPIKTNITLLSNETKLSRPTIYKCLDSLCILDTIAYVKDSNNIIINYLEPTVIHSVKN